MGRDLSRAAVTPTRCIRSPGTMLTMESAREMPSVFATLLPRGPSAATMGTTENPVPHTADGDERTATAPAGSGLGVLTRSDPPRDVRVPV